MGEIVGAGIVAHVPTIMLPEEVRRGINNGQEISLVTGLRRLRTEIFERLRPSTVIVLDTHWETTFEHIVTSHERRSGHFTSSELPRGMHGIAYDLPGDPELALALESAAMGREDTWVLACDDPYLPIYYGSINVWSYLNGGERWVSIGINQTCETSDFLLLGRLLREAISSVDDRRVVILASGGMSHRFFPFRELRLHEPSDPVHVITPEARAADEHVLTLLAEGDHGAVIDEMPQYRTHGPEGRFGHYLIMVGALGAHECTAPGRQLSDYEASVGTGQAHVWFERPARGWTA